MTDPVKIAKIIKTGEFDPGQCKDDGEIIEQAAGMMDSACTWDICGENLFLGEDGKYYTVTVEAEFAEANPAWVKEVLAEEDEQ
jgi:hypothetical protein